MSIKLTTQMDWVKYASYSKYHPDNLQRPDNFKLPDPTAISETAAEDTVAAALQPLVAATGPLDAAAMARAKAFLDEREVASLEEIAAAGLKDEFLAALKLEPGPHGLAETLLANMGTVEEETLPAQPDAEGGHGPGGERGPGGQA